MRESSSNIKLALGVGCLWLVLSSMGCDQQRPIKASSTSTSSSPTSTSTTEQPTSLPADSNAAGSLTASPALTKEQHASSVLATVNGEPITQQDLQQAMKKMMGSGSTLYHDVGTLDKQQLHNSLLSSLVFAKAMAIKAKSALNPAHLQEIERHVQLYHQELLTSAYLKQVQANNPVTDDNIEAYYNTYPEQFGGESIKSYHLLKSEPFSSGGEHQRLTQQMQSIVKTTHWKQSAALNSMIHYQQAKVQTELIDKALLQLIKTTPVGETSDIAVIQNRLYVVKIIDEKGKPARPLEEVRDQIRTLLNEETYRASVTDRLEQVVAEMDVVYLQDERSESDEQQSPTE